MPATVGELGPGDSLGIGLTALLCGVEHYYALDVVKHSNWPRNLQIFDELNGLFQQRADIPNESEFPNIYPLLDDYKFPRWILTEELLKVSLHPTRVEAIRNILLNQNQVANDTVIYFAPWNAQQLIRDGSIDFAYSQYVLEHVDDLPGTYQNLYRWIRPGGMMSHMVDFHSHGTATKWNGHWTYNDFAWSLIKGGRPFLLNREPIGRHLKLLEENSFRLAKLIKYEGADGITRKGLAAKYKNITDEDLAAARGFLVAHR